MITSFLINDCVISTSRCDSIRNKFSSIVLVKWVLRMFCAKNYGTASICVKVIPRKLLASFFPDTVYIIQLRASLQGYHILPGFSGLDNSHFKSRPKIGRLSVLERWSLANHAAVLSSIVIAFRLSVCPSVCHMLVWWLRSRGLRSQTAPSSSFSVK